ncbi:MAG: hypothetical protein GY796_18585 [Chloroflexi bacterium]|nr:hypothetical protein [Chloroflexota bacterium]
MLTAALMVVGVSLRLLLAAEWVHLAGIVAGTVVLLATAVIGRQVKLQN